MRGAMDTWLQPIVKTSDPTILSTGFWSVDPPWLTGTGTDVVGPELLAIYWEGKCGRRLSLKVTYRIHIFDLYFLRSSTVVALQISPN